MKKRFFAFGCSFTNYKWPTWADIINHEKKFIDYQNWGMPGASNKFIHNSIIEAHLKNNISKDDVVIVMWSTYNRDVFYNDIDKKWQHSDVFFESDPRGAKNYHELRARTTSDKATLIENLSLIYSADLLLSRIGCEYYFLSMVDLTDLNYRKNKEIYKKYDFLLKKIKPSVFKTLYNNNWKNKKKKVYNTQEQINRQKKFYSNIQHELFRNAYEDVAGQDWPDFDDYHSDKIKNVSEEILKEIDYFIEKSNWKSYNLKELDYVHSMPFEIDLHPTPAEHLCYINQILVDIDISNETKEWVSLIEKKVLHNKNLNNLWVNTMVNRW